jgi:hypothetical protein
MGVNYTSVKVDDVDGHITWQYGLPLRYPDGVSPAA